MDASLLTNVAEFNDFCNLKAKGRIINLERILNRPPIILVGKTTENFVKLLKEIYNGN